MHQETHTELFTAASLLLAKDWVQGFINNRLGKCGTHLYSGILYGNENELTALKCPW